MTAAILSTLAVLIPTLCMLSLVAVAYERKPLYPLTYDKEEQAWCITLVGEPGDPRMYFMSKQLAEETLDWLENRKEKRNG